MNAGDREESGAQEDVSLGGVVRGCMCGGGLAGQGHREIWPQVFRTPSGLQGDESVTRAAAYVKRVS